MIIQYTFFPYILCIILDCRCIWQLCRLNGHGCYNCQCALKRTSNMLLIITRYINKCNCIYVCLFACTTVVVYPLSPCILERVRLLLCTHSLPASWRESDCCCVPTLSLHLGESPTVVVNPRPGLDLTDILRFCEQQIRTCGGDRLLACPKNGIRSPSLDAWDS